MVDIKHEKGITEKNVRSIRPGFGLHPKYYKAVMDIVSKSELEADHFTLRLLIKRSKTISREVISY